MGRESTSHDEPLASKTVTLEWSGTAEEVKRVLDDAAAGKLDRIPINLGDGTVFLSIEKINVGPDIPGIAPQTWSKREQNRDIETTPDSEQGNSR